MSGRAFPRTALTDGAAGGERGAGARAEGAGSPSPRARMSPGLEEPRDARVAEVAEEVG